MKMCLEDFLDANVKLLKMWNLLNTSGKQL